MANYEYLQQSTRDRSSLHLDDMGAKARAASADAKLGPAVVARAGLVGVPLKVTQSLWRDGGLHAPLCVCVIVCVCARVCVCVCSAA
jgi:hypothetical protein